MCSRLPAFAAAAALPTSFATSLSSTCARAPVRAAPAPASAARAVVTMDMVAKPATDVAPTPSESLSATTLLVDGGEDGEAEADDLEMLGELTEPSEYINAAAIAAARATYRLHETDTGSPEIQIATLTTKITYLTTHLKEHPKDFSSTRGLLKMVSTRRRLLKFLKKEDPARFTAILEGMNIRVSQELRSM